LIDIWLWPHQFPQVGDNNHGKQSLERWAKATSIHHTYCKTRRSASDHTYSNWRGRGKIVPYFLVISFLPSLVITIPNEHRLLCEQVLFGTSFCHLLEDSMENLNFFLKILKTHSFLKIDHHEWTTLGRWPLWRDGNMSRKCIISSPTQIQARLMSSDVPIARIARSCSRILFLLSMSFRIHHPFGCSTTPKRTMLPTSSSWCSTKKLGHSFPK
jgi:hypothetical protein